MDTSEKFASAAELVLAHINRLTDSLRSQCRLFELERIVSFKKLVVNRIKLYTAVLVMRPGDAWFEATLKLVEKQRQSRQSLSSRLKLNDDPIRLSAYGNQSHCIKHPTLVNYCYCNDL